MSIDQFHHGVRIIPISGPAPILAVSSSVVGVVVTAPEADETVFPLDTPVSIWGEPQKAALLGAGEGYLSVKAILAQAGAPIVVVRVAEGADEAATIANVIGGVDADTQALMGVRALEAASAELGMEPKLIAAPGWTGRSGAASDPVAAQLLETANRLRAHAFLDAPNTTQAEAVQYRSLFGDRRAFVGYPRLRVWDEDAGAEAEAPYSAVFLGVTARTDFDAGPASSPSNKAMQGVVGMTKRVSWSLMGADSQTNYLNQNCVATAVNDAGLWTWGNYTCAVDPQYQFLSVSRVDDLFAEAVARAERRRVDMPMTRARLEDMVEEIQQYADENDQNHSAAPLFVRAQVWLDQEQMTPSRTSKGQAFVRWRWTPIHPMQDLILMPQITNQYAVELF